jgi:general secretion pathway protein H
MSRSKTGDGARSERAVTAGFSLLELLVVVTIIGIFAGAAVLSLGILGNDREVEREAFRLRSLLQLAREEALMQGRDYGVLFDETGYRFYIYDYPHSVWVDAPGDELFKPHRLREPIRMSLSLEDRQLVLGASGSEQDREQAKQPKPQVVVLSSGELTPFEIDFYRGVGEGMFVLNAELDGTLEISQSGFD